MVIPLAEMARVRIYKNYTRRLTLTAARKITGHSFYRQEQKKHHPDLFPKDEERRRIIRVLAGEGTVNRSLVDECVSTFGSQDFPFFFVVTDIGVEAVGQQGDHNVQVIVWPHVVEHLIHQALCTEKESTFVQFLTENNETGGIRDMP